MTPDEQRALVQFFGTVHAQAKQTDQMIVGNSQFVKPVSPIIQHQLEQALRIPVQADIQQAPPPQYTESSVQPITQQVQDIQQYTIEQPQTAPAVEPQPVVHSSSMIDILKEINLNLIRIGDILERYNDKPKRAKASKSD